MASTYAAAWSAAGSASWTADQRRPYRGGNANAPVDFYWTGDTDDVSTKIANWSLATGGADALVLPDANDPVIFDTNGDANCTLAGNVSWGSISSPDGYTSTFDWDDNDITLATGGDATFAATGGTVDCGSGTLTLNNGSFDNSAVGTFTAGTSTIVMQGVGTLTGHYTRDVYHLTIGVGAVVTIPNSIDIAGIATINGTLSIDNGADVKSRVSTNTKIGAAGNLTGLGTYTIDDAGASEGITEFISGGIVDVAVLQIYFPNAAAVFAVGTYASALTRIRNSLAAAYTLTLSATPGIPYTFSGDLEFENSHVGVGTLTIDNANDPDIVLQGDVVWDNSGGGTIVYTKGNGSLTASGGSNQDWDFGGSAIEDVIVSKSAGYLLFSEDCDPDSITQTAGEIRITTGKTITAANAAFADDLTGVGGAATLSVAGTNIAFNSVVTNITCDDVNLNALVSNGCADGGNNTNVDFV